MARDPIRPTDDQARTLARRLMREARFGALGVVIDGAPHVTRVAVACGEDGIPMTLVSDLSLHTRAMRTEPRVSLLLGEPGERGDPLTHPRMTLAATAQFVDKTPERRESFLSHIPKAKLYFDFADFHLVRLMPVLGYLNGGFGQAFQLSPNDLIAGSD